MAPPIGARPAPESGAEDGPRRRRILAIGAIAFAALAAIVAGLGLLRPDLLTKDNINLAYRVILFSVVIAFFASIRRAMFLWRHLIALR